MTQPSCPRTSIARDFRVDRDIHFIQASRTVGEQGFDSTMTRADDLTIRILGTHGVPATYGGFETAAQNVAFYMRDNGWRVVVYCQAPGTGQVTNDVWQGIERVTIPVARDGWLGTSEFDLRSIRHASRFRDVCLTFGYNTAIFNLAQKVKRIPNIINMDGIEWSRSRWGVARQAILYTNERIACIIGDALIADHPTIERYLRKRASPKKISTITYGADAVEDAPVRPVLSRGLVPGQYLTLICRPIPENSILELVRAFSGSPRGHTLAVIGDYLPEKDSYHAAVVNAASDEVRFLGSIYDPVELKALRYHASGYLHGHTVGGTNPSLVEAMGAGNAIVAHDNEYNRWVAQDGALYFDSEEAADHQIGRIVMDRDLRILLSDASRRRHQAEFTWAHVAGQYERLLRAYAREVGAREKSNE